MKKQTQNSENLEIPSKGRRFFAYALDLIINITVIGLIINLLIIFVKKTTLGNILTGIETIKNNNKSINIGQATGRYLVFYQTLPLLIFWLDMIHTFFWMFKHICVGYGDNGSDFCGSNTNGNVLFYILCALSIICIINIVEIFFKCPTFIDKRLGIKRLYKKSK